MKKIFFFISGINGQSDVVQECTYGNGLVPTKEKGYWEPCRQRVFDVICQRNPSCREARSDLNRPCIVNQTILNY